VATLRIIRDSGFVDFLRAYFVVVDGEKVGKIRNGKTKEFPISSGRNELSLRIDWCGSRTIQFNANELDTLTFFAKSGRGERGPGDKFGIVEPESWISLTQER